MATVPAVPEEPPLGSLFPPGVLVYKWTGLTEADTATPVIAPRHSEKSVQVNGTFGAGGTIIFEGTLETAAAPAAYQQLHDPSQNNLSYTSAGLDTVLENVYQIRPRVSAGTGVAVDVRLMLRTKTP
jgi:hypothetical protein